MTQANNAKWCPLEKLQDAAQVVAGLSAWEKSQLRSGGDFLLNGVGFVRAGTPESEALRVALREVEAMQ